MKKIYTIIFALAALIGCQKVDTPTLENDDQMKFNMSLPCNTKATAAEFESGDQVGIFVVEYNNDVPFPLQISGNWANNVKTQYDGSSWKPSKKIYWPENRVDVYGYYPYMQLNSVDEQLFSVTLDQDVPESAEQLSGYEQSDLLWAKAEGLSQDSETVTLNYKHILSKLIINLHKGPDFEGEFPDDGAIYIHNTVTSARVDLASGVAMKDMSSTTSTIKAHKIDNVTYEAIVVPQRLETRRPLIEYVAGDVSFLLEDLFYFRNAKEHILNLTINSSPDQIEIEVGGSVGDWN
jgi:hypothetical protein